jgi:hypothetical protein
VYNYILNIVNDVVSQENTRWIVAPVAIVGALSISTRVTAGVLAQGIKGASLVADYADKKDLCESLAQVETRCISFATRGIKTELKATATMTAIVAFCLGLEALIPQQEPTLNEKIISVVSPLFHNVIGDMVAHPIKSYFQISLATILLSACYSWAEVAGRNLQPYCIGK